MQRVHEVRGSQGNQGLEWTHVTTDHGITLAGTLLLRRCMQEDGVGLPGPEEATLAPPHWDTPLSMSSDMSWRPEVTKLQRENSRSHTSHVLSPPCPLGELWVSLGSASPSVRQKSSQSPLHGRTTQTKWVNSGKALRGSYFQVATHHVVQ